MRHQLFQTIEARKSEILDIAINLLKIPCETEQQNTTEIMEYIKSILKNKEGIEIKSFSKKENIENLIIKLNGQGSGNTLAFNGHVDTFPVGNVKKWSYSPFGEVVDKKYLYGRGAADMKGAIAAYLFLLIYMWEKRETWRGCLKLIIVGDEQTGGSYGTKFLLDNVAAEAQADALINGDMGSPYILRIGEKGLVWIELKAMGRGGHGAFVHDGVNAIDLLVQTIEKIKQRLQELKPLEDHEEPQRIIEASRGVLKHHNLPFEADTLNKMTVNTGYLLGGKTINLIAEEAQAGLDIRIPCCFETQQVISVLEKICETEKDITYSLIDRVEPNWTSAGELIVKLLQNNCKKILEQPVTATGRIGASDSAYYRLEGIPSVNCGLTAHNAGRPDEYIEIDELVRLTTVFISTALDYLD